MFFFFFSDEKFTDLEIESPGGRLEKLLLQLRNDSKFQKLSRQNVQNSVNSLK